MLVLTHAQLADMAEPPRKKQRTRMVLEMEAAWQLFSAKWQPYFKRNLTCDERKAGFGEVYDWGIEKGLLKKADYLRLGIDMMRATYYSKGRPEIHSRNPRLRLQRFPKSL